MKNFATSHRITNLDYLKTVADNDQEFIQKMIGSFVSQTPGMLSQMQTHIDQEEWKEVGQIAHKMRPLLTFMGLNLLKELNEKMEMNCIKGKNLEEIPLMVNELTAHCQIAFQELQEDLQNETE